MRGKKEGIGKNIFTDGSRYEGTKGQSEKRLKRLYASLESADLFLVKASGVVT